MLNLKARRMPQDARKPLKVTPKRRKKTPLKKLKLRLWELCKEITRKKYQRENRTWVCYTCDRIIDEPAKAHTGHGIASAVGGVLLRYHLDNLRIQDYFCNVNLGGNGGEYYRRLVQEIGQEKVDSLYQLKHQTIKADELWYEEKIREYEDILKTL